VNQPADRVAGPYSQQPENDQYHKNCPQQDKAPFKELAVRRRLWLTPAQPAVIPQCSVALGLSPQRPALSQGGNPTDRDSFPPGCLFCPDPYRRKARGRGG
jgi:hypothetical protein